MQDLDSFEKQASEPDETDQQALWLRGGYLFSLSLSPGGLLQTYISSLSQSFRSFFKLYATSMQMHGRCIQVGETCKTSWASIFKVFLTLNTSLDTLYHILVSTLNCMCLQVWRLQCLQWWGRAT